MNLTNSSKAPLCFLLPLGELCQLQPAPPETSLLGPCRFWAIVHVQDLCFYQQVSLSHWECGEEMGGEEGWQLPNHRFPSRRAARDTQGVKCVCFSAASPFLPRPPSSPPAPLAHAASVCCRGPGLMPSAGWLPARFEGTVCKASTEPSLSS